MSTITIRAVAEYFNVTPEEILSRNRHSDITIARNIVCLVMRDRDKLSFPVIGRRLAKRDHSTIMHSVRRAREAVALDPKLAAFVAKEMTLSPYRHRPVAINDNVERVEPAPAPVELPENPKEPSRLAYRVKVKNEPVLCDRNARMILRGTFALQRALEAAMAERASIQG